MGSLDDFLCWLPLILGKSRPRMMVEKEKVGLEDAGTMSWESGSGAVTAVLGECWHEVCMKLRCDWPCLIELWVWGPALYSCFLTPQWD